MHKNSEKKIMFQMSAYAKYTYFHERLQYPFIENRYEIYKHPFLSIHTNGTQEI